jgi:GT2 family glycosyltransferase
MNADRFSLIIVTFNHEREITACLEAAGRQDWPMEVFIIDNASMDGTRNRVERFQIKHPEIPIQVIGNQTNVGYAAAVNQGLKLSRTPWIALLGPDARMKPDTASTIVGYLKTHPEVGIAGPKLTRPDGRTQPSCRRFPTLKDLFIELSGMPRIFPESVSPEWKMPDFDHARTAEVEQLEATCLFVRRSAMHEVGLMDERFPIFFNDVDWCRRFHRLGWKAVFLPNAEVEHDRGSSVFRNRVPLIWKSHQGFYRYFKKYAAGFFERIFIEPLGWLLIGAALMRTVIRIAPPAQRPRQTHTDTDA